MIQVGDIVEDLTLGMIGYVIGIVVVLGSAIYHIKFFNCDDETVGVLLQDLRKINH